MVQNDWNAIFLYKLAIYHENEGLQNKYIFDSVKYTQRIPCVPIIP